MRSLVRVLRLTAALDRRRARLALVPIVPLLGGVPALVGRSLIDRQDSGLAATVVAAAVAGLVMVVMATGVWWQVTTANMRLAELTGVELDRMLITAMSSRRPLAVFDDPLVLDRLERLRIDRQAIASSMSLLRDLLGIVVTLVVSMALLATVDARLALLPIGLVPVVWAYLHAESLANAAEDRVAEARREALHLFDVGTSPAAGKEIRMVGAMDAVQARHAERWSFIDGTLTSAVANGAAWRLFGWTLFGALVAGAFFLTVGSGGGDIDGGEVFIVVMAILQLTDTAGGAASAIAQLRRTAAMARMLDDVVQPDAQLTVHERLAPSRLGHGIELRDVTFTYPGAARAAVGPIDLQLHAGTCVALVGSNGAGKSTLVKLLCGLLRPTAGVVLVDGDDLAGIDAEAWADRLAAVFQDFARFELRAREAVGVGDLGRLDDEGALQEALRRGDAEAVVGALPAGLDSQLGSQFGGVDLSGGQWQRVAAARGLMRDAPLLLVLDEPTVALDAASEQALIRRCMDSAKALAAERGTIAVFVTHRYSAVRLADRIVVVDGGRVTEVGRHEELMAAQGQYARTYEQQVGAFR